MVPRRGLGGPVQETLGIFGKKLARLRMANRAGAASFQTLLGAPGQVLCVFVSARDLASRPDAKSLWPRRFAASANRDRASAVFYSALGLWVGGLGGRFGGGSWSDG